MASACGTIELLRQESRRPGLALTAHAAAVILLLAVLGWETWPRTGNSSALPSPTAPACDGSAAPALVGPRTSGLWLRTALEAVEPSDPRTNQLRWLVRFTVPAGAPGPAIVDVRARFTVAGQGALQVLGYDLVEPTQRP